LFKSVELCIYW